MTGVVYCPRCGAGITSPTRKGYRCGNPNCAHIWQEPRA